MGIKYYLQLFYFSTLIFLYNPILVIPLVLCSLLIELKGSQEKSPLIFGSFSLIYYFLFEGVFSQKILFWDIHLIEELNLKIDLGLNVFNLIAIKIASLLLVYFLVLYYKKISVLHGVVFFLVLLSLKQLIYFKNIIYVVAPGIILAKLFWPMMYLSLNKHKKNSFSIFGVLYPIWENYNISQVPKLKSVQDLSNYDKSSELKYNGLKLIIIGLFSQVAAKLVLDIIFNTGTQSFISIPSIGILNYKIISLSEYNKLEIDLLSQWIAVLGNGLVFLLIEVFGFPFIIIGIARFFGFNLLLNVNRPFKAKSFYEFYGRMFYYYNLILMEFFFYPIWTRLNLITNKTLKLTIVTFFTIFFGGQVIHLIKDFPGLITSSRGLNVIELIGSRSPYFLILGLVITVSILFRNKKELNLSLDSKPLRIIKTTSYFIGYCLILALYTNSEELNLTEQIKLVLNLFGINNFRIF